jgi:predicted nucleotidyltransferase
VAWHMHTLTEHPIDSATRKTAFAFLDKAAKAFTVKGAILFGSRAKGEFRADSDADIAVVLPGNRGQFMAAKLALADMAFDVLLETGIRVQPLPVWEDEWAHPESYSNPALLRNIESDGVRLW